MLCEIRQQYILQKKTQSNFILYEFLKHKQIDH